MLIETCLFCGRVMPGKIPTNADRIRSMSDEELAEYNCDRKIGCKLIEEVKAQFSASQARERAAVEMLKSANLCRQCAYDAQCGSTNHYRQQKRIYGHCDHWQWRGLQDVEEGK